MIYNQSCGTDGALSRKPKNTEMNKFISVFLSFRDFCLFAIVVFFEVPLVLSFQGKNRKKNFNLDILNRCQFDKLKYICNGSNLDNITDGLHFAVKLAAHMGAFQKLRACLFENVVLEPFLINQSVLQFRP